MWPARSLKQKTLNHWVLRAIPTRCHALIPIERYRRFFETKEQAQKFIFETKRNGSIELADLAVEEKHVLGVIRQSQKYEPRLLLEAWRRFESEGSGEGANLTVQQLCEKFFARQIAERRSAQTLAERFRRL